MAFRKVLVANRGEIACRVIRSAKALGYATVAVASEVDADAEHVRLADEAVVIGPPPVGQSYLDAAKLVDAARRTGADAIHPGYGFLSERAEFAEACARAGIVFIGPTPEAIRAMGDKAESKRRMIAAGVPCVPGYEGAEQDDARLIAEGERIGFPIMVKASAGGGGRGMRLTATAKELPMALASARSEARNAFGDDTLLLERAVVNARHVEIQVFGDRHGAIVHLGERDCSIQRRHQKVVEEAPSPAVDPDLRARMGAAAVRAAQAIDYVGAGTVEFLLDPDGAFYFLEMNTRLQVEHPVTECVTGLDLVALQLEVAAGKPLPFSQADVDLKGHAIEVRLYAEDPATGFLPQSGPVTVWRPPSGEGVRVDHGLHPGGAITPFYDPMIAKVVAQGRDREEARRRLVRALKETAVLGLATNKAFLIETLEAAEFVSGAATTAFIERTFPEGRWAPPPPSPEVFALAAVLLSQGEAGGWRSSGWPAHAVTLLQGEERVRVLTRREAEDWVVEGPGGDIRLAVAAPSPDAVSWRVDGRLRNARFALDGVDLHLDIGDAVYVFRDDSYVASAGSAASQGAMRAPMSGTVVSVHVALGDRVSRGQLLVVLEAMKMEHQIVAAADGVVETVEAAAGAQVANRALLVSLRAEETVA